IAGELRVWEFGISIGAEGTSGCSADFGAAGPPSSDGEPEQAGSEQGRLSSSDFGAAGPSSSDFVATSDDGCMRGSVISMTSCGDRNQSSRARWSAGDVVGMVRLGSCWTKTGSSKV